MKVFTIEEFAARRRRDQSELERRLFRIVEDAVASLGEGDADWAVPLLEAVDEAFTEVFEAEGGESPSSLFTQFHNQVSRALEETVPESNPELIATWLATAILNSATMAAAAQDEEFLVMEWVTMEDDAVRETHRDVEGQQRPVGEPFVVGGEEMPYPGYPGVSPALWMNCRCALAPAYPEEASFRMETLAISEKAWDGSASRFTPEEWKRATILHVCDGIEKSCHKLPIHEPNGDLSRAGVHAAAARINQVDAPPAKVASAKRVLRGAYRKLGEEVPDVLTAAGDKHTSLTVMALPEQADPVHEVGPEQKHMTLLWLGDGAGVDREALHAAVAAVAKAAPSTMFEAGVTEVGELGDEGAHVWFADSPPAVELREALLQDEGIAAAFNSVEQYPEFTPHVTIGYSGDDSHGSGTGMSLTDDNLDEARQVTAIMFDRLAVWDGEEQTEYALGEAMPEETETEEVVATAVPWHGVLAPEGEWSGDGRRFAENALTFRDLPLPLTWQKASSDGHSGSVVVARIDKIARVDGEMRGTGSFLQSAESDEVIGMIAEFGKFGVSVDADDAEFEFGEGDDKITFTKARIASASIVAIPAFAQAYVALGEAPEDFLPAEEAEQEVAAAEETVIFKRGKGWITHPADTKRLHDYWTKPGEPGYAKIGWGKGGDFNRCRVLVGEKIAKNSPEDVRFLNQICAQWHKDALGIWPGEHKAAAESETFAGQTAPAVTLTASGETLKAPAKWFKNPEFTQPTHLTVTEEGQVFGHIAEWGQCHIGYDGVCVNPPFSQTDYAYFASGAVLLDDGTTARTGILSVGGGHAGANLRWRAAMEHYDSTSAAVADIAVGEDEFGIWAAGWVRPGATPEQVVALRASKVSGDWREVVRGSGELELVAALAVNVPGFPVKVAAASGRQISLVAAGVVGTEKPSDTVAEIARAVVAQLKRIDRVEQLKSRVGATEGEK